MGVHTEEGMRMVVHTSLPIWRWGRKGVGEERGGEGGFPVWSEGAGGLISFKLNEVKRYVLMILNWTREFPEQDDSCDERDGKTFKLWEALET